MSGPLRILILDIETAPHRVFAWSLWDQTNREDQFEEPGYTLCLSYRWLGTKATEFVILRRRASDPTDLKALKAVHGLISSADAVVHYNGKKFDMPTLNREFLEAGLRPPAPPQNIDLYADARAGA